MRWNAASMIAVVLASAAVIALIGWIMWPEPMPSVTPPTAQAVTLPPAVSAAPSIEIPETRTPSRPPIKAIQKTPQIREKTKLPPALFDAPETYLLSTATLDAEERRYTLTGTLDRRTGESSISAVAEPLPWLRLPKRGALGIGYTSDQEIRLRGRYDLVQSKALVLNVEVQADTSGDRDATIFFDWRF